MRIRHLILLLLLLAMTRPLFAAPVVPEWATWEFSADFVNQNINGRYQVSIGVDIDGEPVVLHSETIVLKCWAVGNVNLIADYADIAAGGHVQCTLPDFSQTVDDIIIREFGAAHVLNLPQSCNCTGKSKGPVTVEAKADLTVKGNHPIFDHPNFQFELNSFDKYRQHVLTVNGAVGQSNWEVMPPGLHENLSTYECDDAACAFAHYLNGGQFDGSLDAHAELWFDGGETIVTLGKNMTGKLYNVEVDPGCYAG